MPLLNAMLYYFRLFLPIFFFSFKTIEWRLLFGLNVYEHLDGKI